MHPSDAQFPIPLSAYPTVAGSLIDVLWSRIEADPFNAIATVLFLSLIHI